MNYLEQLINALNNISVTQYADITNEKGYDSGIAQITALLSNSKAKQETLFFCGNGGSAGIAIHMESDFLKNGGFLVSGMFNASTLTCLGNDLGFEYIFSAQLKQKATSTSCLIAISSSGESQNIINAVRSVREKGGRIITFSGFEADNSLRMLGDINLYVPVKEYGIVESVHNLVLQQIVDFFVQRDGVALNLSNR